MHPMRTLIDLTESSEGIPHELALQIAQQVFGFRTLDMQNRDQLDFKDVSKDSVRRALDAAYRAGVESHRVK